MLRAVGRCTPVPLPEKAFEEYTLPYPLTFIDVVES
jgi:hypothetical protein